MPSTARELRSACRDHVEIFDQTFDSSARAGSRHHGQAAGACRTCTVRRDCSPQALTVETTSARCDVRSGLVPAQRSRPARQSA